MDVTLAAVDASFVLEYRANMGRRAVQQFVVGVGVGVVCSSCGGAHQRLAGYPVAAHRPVAIWVSISDQVNASDDGGGVATLAETVSDELKENGIESQIYASAEDHPPPPRIELHVLYWHGTPRLSHQLAAAGMAVGVVGVGALVTAGNNIVVDCRVFVPGSALPAFTQRFEASGMGLGWTQTDDNAAAAHAASAIVSQILTE